MYIQLTLNKFHTIIRIIVNQYTLLIYKKGSTLNILSGISHSKDKLVDSFNDFHSNNVGGNNRPVESLCQHKSFCWQYDL